MATASVFEIPLQPRPQRFSVTLLGVSYGMRTRWNDAAGVWVLDISDVNGNELVNGLAMITGADLLGQLGYLGIGGQLLVIPTQPTNEQVPGFADLGTTWALVFSPNI